MEDREGVCVYVSVEAQIIDSFRIQTTSRNRVLKDFSCQGVGENVYPAAVCLSGG